MLLRPEGRYELVRKYSAAFRLGRDARSGETGIEPARSQDADGRDSESPDPGDRRIAGRFEKWWPALATAVLVIGANVLALSGFRLALVGPAVGFWLVLVHPVYLLCTSSLWRRAAAAERVGYGVAGVILLLYICGLAINALLPAVGVSRPLDTVPHL